MRKQKASLWLQIELHGHKFHQKLCIHVDYELSQRVLFYLSNHFQKHQAYSKRPTKVPITRLTEALGTRF